jgi:hypothetical protein
MTLIVLGLLFGMLVLVWAMILDIIRTDRSTKTQRARDLNNPVVEAARRESKAA